MGIRDGSSDVCSSDRPSLRDRVEISQEAQMQHEEDTGDGWVSKRKADIVAAAMMAGIGGVVIIDSLRLGMGWAVDGPESGYFPFYIGVAIVVASIGTIVAAVLRTAASRGNFVERAQLKDVFKVLTPAAVFVASIGFLGVYVASTLFIGAFMRWIGRFPWHTIDRKSVV